VSTEDEENGGLFDFRFEMRIITTAHWWFLTRGPMLSLDLSEEVRECWEDPCCHWPFPKRCVNVGESLSIKRTHPMHIKFIAFTY
jgi:hypothetical protein